MSHVHSLDPSFNIQCSCRSHLLTHNRDESSFLISEESNHHIDWWLQSSLPHPRKSYCAKWILKTSETRSLTRRATLGIGSLLVSAGHELHLFWQVAKWAKWMHQWSLALMIYLFRQSQGLSKVELLSRPLSRPLQPDSKYVLGLFLASLSFISPVIHFSSMQEPKSLNYSKTCRYTCWKENGSDVHSFA